LNKIEALGAKCMFVPIDVADVESVKNAISKTVDKYNVAVTESLKRINELISKL
jgi:hypothetical protein